MNRNRKGFTLPELMVVMAISAMMILVLIKEDATTLVELNDLLAGMDYSGWTREACTIRKVFALVSRLTDEAEQTRQRILEGGEVGL